jgi:hypothetical protein
MSQVQQFAVAVDVGFCIVRVFASKPNDPEPAGRIAAKRVFGLLFDDGLHYTALRFVFVDVFIQEFDLPRNGSFNIVLVVHIVLVHLVVHVFPVRICSTINIQVFQDLRAFAFSAVGVINPP